MHSLKAWGVSAGVAAVLIAVTLMRAPPQRPGQWSVILGIWVVGTVVLHLLLHNRVMHELDARSRARLARWREERAGTGPASPSSPSPRPAGSRPDPPRLRGPGHATRRGLPVQLPVPGAGHEASTDRRPVGSAHGRRSRYDRRGRPASRRAR